MSILLILLALLFQAQAQEEADTPVIEILGFGIGPGWDNDSVIITSVRQPPGLLRKGGSPYSPGVVIVSFNRRRVQTVAQFREILGELNSGDVVEMKAKGERFSSSGRVSFFTWTMKVRIGLPFFKGDSTDPIERTDSTDGGIPGFYGLYSSRPIAVVGPRELELASFGRPRDPHITFHIRFQVEDARIQKAILIFEWAGPLSASIRSCKLASGDTFVKWSLQDFVVEDVIRGPGMVDLMSKKDERYLVKYCTKELTFSDLSKLNMIVDVGEGLELWFPGSPTTKRKFRVTALQGIRKALQLIEDQGFEPPGISENSIGLRFSSIPAGQFKMGSPQAEPERASSETSHKVTLTKAFELGIYEVTQSQFEMVMGKNPSDFRGPENPVENVSWNEAVEFCRRLSELPEEKAARHVYRLPTEAEWEYACRAGVDKLHNFGKDSSRLGDFCWFDQNSAGTTNSVGQKKANCLGLFDMHGNVTEWCQDWNADLPDRTQKDPVGPTLGNTRVTRGGGYSSSAGQMRSAYRGAEPPEYTANSLGFRVVQER